LDCIAATFRGVGADYAENRAARGAGEDHDAAPKPPTYWAAVNWSFSTGAET